MKICVMGAGGLGGFFGGWLADAGEAVSFVARGAHLEAMRANGLEIRSAAGDKLIRPVDATDDPATVGPVDLVLFCVKSYGLEAAAEQCRPLLHDDTAVVSLLNGVDAPGQLARLLGERHAVGGLTYIPSNIAAPGVIQHQGTQATLSFGELDGRESPRLVAFREACRNAGIEADLSHEIEVALWTKFAAWAASAGAMALSRQPFGGLQSVPALRALYADAMAEAVAVGRAKGIALAPDVEEKLMVGLDSVPPGAKSSTLVDLENDKPLELEAGVGSVVRQGAEVGIDTPVCRTIYAGLLPFIDGQ